MLKATIDRFDEGSAVVIVRGDMPTALLIPEWLLPEGCKEGDLLDISITRDVEGTEAAKKRVSDLIEKLKKKNAE